MGVITWHIPSCGMPCSRSFASHNTALATGKGWDRHAADAAWRVTSQRGLWPPTNWSLPYQEVLLPPGRSTWTCCFVEESPTVNSLSMGNLKRVPVTANMSIWVRWKLTHHDQPGMSSGKSNCQVMSGFSYLAIVSPRTEKVRAGDDCLLWQRSKFLKAAQQNSARNDKIYWPHTMRVSGSSCDSYYAKYSSDASAWESSSFLSSANLPFWGPVCDEHTYKVVPPS